MTAEFGENRNPLHILRLENVGPNDHFLAGGKAVNLGIMIRAGLPVPRGYCITTEAHDYFKENGKLPEGLTKQINEIRRALGGRIAIRSSGDCEDGDGLSMAGVFETSYCGPSEDVVLVIEKIFRQCQSEEVSKFMGLHGMDCTGLRMGLVVQQLIEPDISGVIYTGVNCDKHLIQYTQGFGRSLVDGETHGSAVLVNGDSGSIISSSGYEALPIFQTKQLVILARRIEKLFGGFPQDIEFAIQKSSLSILQARRLTTELGEVDLRETPSETLERTKSRLREIIAAEKIELGTKRVIFTDNNFIELLPCPTVIDSGVFEYIFTGNDGLPGAIQLGRRQMGYPLGNEAIGMMSYVGGKPFTSIARDAATFYAGFPSPASEYFRTLVNEYLEAIQEDPPKGSYPEIGLYLQDPTYEDLEKRYGNKAEYYFRIYQEFLRRMSTHADGFIDEFYSNHLPEMVSFIEQKQAVDLASLNLSELNDYCFEVLEHLRNQSCVCFVKSARLGFYYFQRLQKEVNERFARQDRQAEVLIAKLSQGLDGSLITDVNLKIIEAGSKKEAIEVAKKLVGHFSTGEMLEIRYPRLKDVPDSLESYVDGIRRSADYRKNFEGQKQERLIVQQSLLLEIADPEERRTIEQVMTASQTYMALRETVKYHFTREYSLLRDALVEIEKRLGLKEGDIFFVYPRELPSLIADTESFVHIIQSRRQSFENYAQLALPSVIREEDVDKLGLKNEADTDFRELEGKFLADGDEIENGMIVNIDGYDDKGELERIIVQCRKEGIPIILAATQMNLGHDPYIAIASGLIIENAGIVSHGAQRARELGKGAIGGIKSSRLKTGMRINFDPKKKKIIRI